MDAEAKSKVSVIISARNEEKCIAETIEGVKPYSGEIIVVDGHSKDRTAEIARSLGARVIEDEGKGKGQAIRMGIAAATRDIVVFIDADGSHDPNDIPKIVAPILKGEADHVTGSRALGGSEELHGTFENFMRMLGNAVIILTVNYRFGTLLSDSQNGFRAIRADVAKQLDLKENITTIEQEMVIKTLHAGYRIAEVPAHEYSRKYGESNISMKKVWFRYIYSWLKYLLFGSKQKALKKKV
jgi:glycosyltransferase involved in cell wall biosynthesis